jgi:hypothetical protein
MVDRDYLPAPASVDEPEIDLGDLLARIWRGKLWVLAAVLACSAIAAVHVFLAARVYRSETVLVLREDEQSGGAVSMLRGSSLGGLASLAGLGTSAAGGRRGEFVAVLKSRRLVREFVVSRELTPLLYASRWDSASNQVRPGPPDGFVRVERSRTRRRLGK